MSAGGDFFPIRELSSYTTKWTIRARVTARGPLRSYTAKGSGAAGKVFNVDLLDKEGGEIRANFFSEGGDLYEKLAIGKCFTFRGGSIRIANRQYNTCNHRYELTFDKAGQVEEVSDDAEIETIKITLSDLRSVQNKSMPCNVDLCGVVVSFKPPFSFKSKDGKELVKREIVLADDTATSMGVTLWGDRAKQDDKDFEGQPVIILKGVSVKEWNGGRSGSFAGGTMLLQPTQPEAERVRQWWVQGGSSASLAFLSQESGTPVSRVRAGKSVCLAELRQAADQVVAEQQTYSIMCRLAVIQTRKQGETQPLSYVACQEPREGTTLLCQRRVDESGFCASCNRSGKVATRLNLRCKFSDFGDSLWLTTFHEAAQQVLNTEADEVRAMELGQKGGREALEALIRRRCFAKPLQVTVRAKLESYNGEQRTGITCVDARPVSHSERGRQLLAEIQELMSGEVLRAGNGGA